MDTLLTMTSWLGVAATAAVAFFGLFMPAAIAGTTGLGTDAPLAKTEVRAALGATFAVLTGALVLVGTPETFLLVGLVWAAAAFVKIVCIFVDGPEIREAIPGIVSDSLAALLVLSGYLVR